MRVKSQGTGETAEKIRAFFEKTPPNVDVRIGNIYETDGAGDHVIYLPEIELHCPQCGGPRQMMPAEEELAAEILLNYEHVRYDCRNCGKYRKTFSIEIDLESVKGPGNIWAPTGGGQLRKLGEAPPFAPVVPKKLDVLLDKDRPLFLRGLSCESQGLGIGAAGYYRRVVNNQTAHLLEELGKVTAKLGGDCSPFDQAIQLAEQGQFKRAVELIKDAVPTSILIDGHHNPMTLLHGSLSEDLHEKTDEECLAVASDTREVLTDLAERITEALKDRSQVSEAVKRLMKKVSKPRDRGAPG